MEAEILLQQLCQLHGVEMTHGQRLLPLVQWALKGPNESRRRILKVVELALRGDPYAEEKSREELAAAADHAILIAVARVVHDWTPDSKVLGLDILKQMGPKEADDAE
ncbi:MAG: hypothetical protein ACI8X5_002282 [Planctomycetota bacterium]|jgi:hypothetical protein